MKKQVYNQPIPEGWATTTIGFTVAAVKYHSTQAKKAIAANDNPDLIMQSEPTNQHDENAIKVIVKTKGAIAALFNKDTHIGYIPMELAAVIIEYELVDKLQIRLKSVYYNDEKEITSIVIDLIGPAAIATREIQERLDDTEY